MLNFYDSYNNTIITIIWNYKYFELISKSQSNITYTNRLININPFLSSSPVITFYITFKHFLSFLNTHYLPWTLISYKCLCIDNNYTTIINLQIKHFAQLINNNLCLSSMIIFFEADKCECIENNHITNIHRHISLFEESIINNTRFSPLMISFVADQLHTLYKQF